MPEARLLPDIRRTRSRISYNALSRLVGRVLGALLSLVALHLAAHYFQPRGWGPIAGALAFILLFSTIADFGVASVLARDLVKSPDPTSLLGAGLKAAIMVSLLITALAAGFGAIVFSSLPLSRSVALILLPSIPASAAFSALSATLVARSRNDIRAVFDVVSSMLPLAGVYVIVRLHLGGDSYGLVIGAASILMVAIAFLVVSRHETVFFRFSGSQVRSILKEAWPLGTSRVAGAIYMQIDVLLVVAFLSRSDVGQYGLASRIATFFVSVPAMVTTAATPAFIRKDEEARRRLASQLQRLLSIGAMGMAAVGIFLARPVLETVGGRQYAPAAGALTLLLLAAGVSFLVGTSWALIYLTGNQRLLFRIGFAVLVANVVANLMAIPLWGIEGAAGALLFSEMVGLIYATSVARRLGYFRHASERTCRARQQCRATGR